MLIDANFLTFNPDIPGYCFEYVPTPLSAGGVGMYIKEGISYKVIEKTSNQSFQGLWIELQFPKKTNVICAILYRQHYSPEDFQNYLDSCLEKYSSSSKPIYILGDFKINLLKFETCRYANDFLLLFQSYPLTPVIDKPTRVHSSSATLIDNILVSQVDDLDSV